MRKDCFITRYNPHPDANELNFSRSVCELWAPLLMSLCSGDGRFSLSSREPGGTEKGVELNSFPSHEFFSASFHANFHFACPKAPSLPLPFTPYSASVACATGGETFSSIGGTRVLSVANKLASRVRNCLSNKNRNLLRIADHDFPRPPFVRPPHHPISHWQAGG